MIVASPIAKIAALAFAPPSLTREFLECCLQKKRYTNRKRDRPGAWSAVVEQITGWDRPLSQSV
jgi:hypothetical protein